ncbi:MAG: thermonuclease family protein [Promethearchaeota archaeon]
MSKKGNRFILAILEICVILSSLNFFVLPVYSWEIDKTGTVNNIVDGDTIDVTSVGRIRLADIDCPEPGEPGGSEASQYISSLIYQKTVYVDVDDITGTDPYGRVVAVIYVYYDDTRLKNVNKAMLVAGHADIWDFDNNEFNPYSWTLYVDYQLNPPPPEDPDPPINPPPSDPPRNDPPPSDPQPPSDNNDTQLVLTDAAYIGIGVGCTFIAASIITSSYALRNKKKKGPKRNIEKRFLYKNTLNTEKSQITKTASSNSIVSPKSSKPGIKDIKANMRNVSVKGKIEKINEVRNFVRSNGSRGRVGSFIISDETGTIRVVLWDNSCSILSDSNFTVGKHAIIVNAYGKINTYYGKNDVEIHFGKFSSLEFK